MEVFEHELLRSKDFDVSTSLPDKHAMNFMKDQDKKKAFIGMLNHAVRPSVRPSVRRWLNYHCFYKFCANPFFTGFWNLFDQSFDESFQHGVSKDCSSFRKLNCDEPQAKRQRLSAQPGDSDDFTTMSEFALPDPPDCMHFSNSFFIIY